MFSGDNKWCDSGVLVPNVSDCRRSNSQFKRGGLWNLGILLVTNSVLLLIISSLLLLICSLNLLLLFFFIVWSVNSTTSHSAGRPARLFNGAIPGILPGPLLLAPQSPLHLLPATPPSHLSTSRLAQPGPGHRLHRCVGLPFAGFVHSKRKRIYLDEKNLYQFCKEHFYSDRDKDVHELGLQ